MIDLEPGFKPIRGGNHFIIKLVFFQGLYNGFNNDHVIIHNKDLFSGALVFFLGDGDSLASHKFFKIGFFYPAMSANGSICFDVSGLNPVDNGFRRNIAMFAGSEYSQRVFHGTSLFGDVEIQVL